jgi:hypothetical protein
VSQSRHSVTTNWLPRCSDWGKGITETGTGTFPRVVWVKRVRCLSGARLLSHHFAFPGEGLFLGGRPRVRSVASSPRCLAVLFDRRTTTVGTSPFGASAQGFNLDAGQ